MAFLKGVLKCAYCCYVTFGYLSQLNRAPSGNPSFIGQFREGVDWTLEIPSLYHSSFSIIEQDSRNLFSKWRVVRSTDGRGIPTTDFTLRHTQMSFRNTRARRVMPDRSRFIFKCFLAYTSRPEKAKETHVAIKARGRGWVADSDKWQMTNDKGGWSMLSDPRIASINIRLRVFFCHLYLTFS